MNSFNRMPLLQLLHMLCCHGMFSYAQCSWILTGPTARWVEVSPLNNQVDPGWSMLTNLVFIF